MVIIWKNYQHRVAIIYAKTPVLISEQSSINFVDENTDGQLEVVESE